MFPPIGQGDAQQSLVHVLGRAVPCAVGAVDVPARSNGHEGGAGAPSHRDSVRTRPGRVRVVALSNGRRPSPAAGYWYSVRPRRSANSVAPVTSEVAHFGISWTFAASSCRRSPALSPGVTRSGCSYGNAAMAENVDTTVRVADHAGQDTGPSRNITRPGESSWDV